MDVISVKDVDVSHKRVLVRVDFNVPLDKESGAVTDDTRIRAALPTIRYLVDKGSRVILCSHLGRPDGKAVEKLRLAPVAERLSQLLGKPVAAARDCIGPDAEVPAGELKDGGVLLLENLRFHSEEEKNDDSFAKALAGLAEIYVDDAFGTAHRTHVSVVGVARHLPAVAGLLLEKELDNLGRILQNPVHPFCGLLGGAKISDKVSMLENILDRVDSLLIGGGMAATFFKAKSFETGLSLIEEEMLDTAVGIIDNAAKRGVHLLLPVDVLVADEIKADAENVKTVTVKDISPDMRIVDIGRQTIAEFEKELRRCKTVFWNGPMGIYEISRFAEGTRKMAEVLASIDTATIIGGGSTADAVNELGLTDKMTFVSTGGGASLKFLSGKVLPGVDALMKKKPGPA